MQLTVREAMDLRGLCRCRLLAGADGLDRVIRYLTVIEVPDIIQWLQGYEFLLTSCYAFREEPEQLLPVVRELHDLGCAALAVKTGRFVDEVPRSVLEFAEENGFPILEIPPEIPYNAITAPMVEYLIQKETRQLRLSEQLHRRFLGEVVRQGGGFRRIALLVSQFLHNPVSVVDPEGRVLVTIHMGHEALQDLKSVAPVPAISPQGEWLRRRRRLGSQDWDQVLVPVHASNQCFGYLVVWEMHRALDHEDQPVFDVALATLALEFSKIQQVETHLSHFRQELVDDLLLGELEDDAQARHRARQAGWEPGGNLFVVMVVEGGAAQPAADLTHQDWEEGTAWRQRLAQTLQEVAVRYCDGALATLRGHRGIVICSFSDLNERLYRHRAGSLGRALNQVLQDYFPDSQPLTGVGRFGSGLAWCGQSYQEAGEALKVAMRTGKKEGVVFFDDMAMYAILLESASRERLLETAGRVLSPLLEYDRTQGTALYRTLDTYLRHNCRLKETAQVMYLHYNTLKYRLKKVQQLTGRNLASEEDRFQIHLALKIYSLCQSGEP